MTTENNLIIKKYSIYFVAAALLLLSGCKTNPPNAPDDIIELGKVFISANVTGAVIWLDGNDTGKLTPDTIEAKTGMHEVSLTKELYHRSTQNIEILKDTTLTVSFDMEEIVDIGKVYVTSNESGASIYLDGEATSRFTPDTITTNPGAHQIKLVKPFYQDISSDVTVVKDSIITLHFDLVDKPIKTTVLLEDFANVSCVPCVTSNKIIESLTKYTYGPSQLVAIKFPTNFPSPNDPFYLANSEDCDARMGYYNIFFAPTTIIDGTERPTPTDSVSVKAAIDQRLQKIPQFRIHVRDAIVGSTYWAIVTIRVENGSGINFSDLVLHTVLTETDIEFATPPGSNGETKFYDVMRTMMPSNIGRSLGGINQNEDNSYILQTEVNASWIIGNLHTVAFI
ncbi:MAG: PEGA domain-containing protein, partial [Ignavibacteriaceae bacterium]|nr:PEGA domain-containing protein [Ignavibacteriaceae bacterium]